MTTAEADHYHAECRQLALLACRDLEELRSCLTIANVCHWIQFADTTPANRRATGPQTPTQSR